MERFGALEEARRVFEDPRRGTLGRGSGRFQVVSRGSSLKVPVRFLRIFMEF